jgi:hypothetical protein
LKWDDAITETNLNSRFIGNFFQQQNQKYDINIAILIFLIAIKILMAAGWCGIYISPCGTSGKKTIEKNNQIFIKFRR